jgi:hypothetical protein
MGWDGMGWDGMGWDGLAWDGMESDGMGWDVTENMTYLLLISSQNAVYAFP